MRKNCTIAEYCSTNTEIALKLFCNRINSSDAEIFIVMAKKAVCLFQYLLDEEKINITLSKKFISSTAVDFDISHLHGKKIAIVDDIIISGSAIAVMLQKLTNDGVDEKNIEIIALARNSDYQMMKFNRMCDGKNMLNCGLDVKDAECIEISYDISHILAYNGRQYDSDFPVYEKIECDKELCKKLTNSNDWIVYDVTNDMHTLGGINANVLIPKDTTLNEFWNTLGVNLETYIHAKLRLYFFDYANGYSVLQIVPMVLFNETSEKDIDTIFSYFASEDICNNANSEKWTYKAKVHYLQFYLADFFLNAVLSKRHFPQLRLSKVTTNANFGPRFSKSIIKSLNQIKNRSKPIILDQKPLAPNMLNFTSVCDSKLQNIDSETYSFEINNMLYTPIKNWYIEEELPVREKLKELSCNYVDFDSNEFLKRLKCGFSFNAFCEILKKNIALSRVDDLVSLFIDRSVDEGIIVPILYHNQEDHYICRAFRHGEDLPFGESDLSRLLYFLLSLDNCFKSENGNKEEGIATITLDKMIVLFYQLGLKKGRIFNRFLGFDNDSILQQRFNVHGIVAAVKTECNHNKKSHVYLSSDADNDGNSTTMITRTFGQYPHIYIKHVKNDGKDNYIINSNKIKEYFNKNKLNNISDEIQANIYNIAKLIQKWYFIENNDDGKDKFKENISALTSCADIFTFSSSIATEIHYFKRYWEEEACRLLKEIQQGHEIKTLSSTSFDQALPSARKKHKWHDEQKAQYVITYVANLFQKQGLTDQLEQWNALWRSNMTTILRGTNQLQELTLKALKYVYFYSDCYEWLCDKRFELDAISSDWRYISEYNSLGQLDETFCHYTTLSELEREKNITRRITEFIAYINTVIDESEQVVDEIEMCQKEKTGIYTIEYHCALVIDIKTKGEVHAKNILRSIFSLLPEDGDKTNINIIEMERINHQYYRYVIFHEQQNLEAIDYLITVYEYIHHICCKYANPTRVIFLPNLMKRLIYKHDLRANISKYIKAFSSELRSILKEIHFSEDLHQLWLVKTNYTLPNVEEEIIKRLKILGYTIHPDKAASKYKNEKLQVDYCSIGIHKRDSDLPTSATVRIDVNGSHSGTGIILNYNHKPYCITCRHVIHSDIKDTVITAISMNNKDSVALTELDSMPRSKTEKKEDDDNDDLVILEPHFEHSANFDCAYFFSRCNCIIDNNKIPREETFSMYGFGGGYSKIGYIVDDLRYVGSLGSGFIQMHSNDTANLNGFSGSPITSMNEINLLGILKASNAGNLLIIPINTILNKIKKHLNLKEKE